MKKIISFLSVVLLLLLMICCTDRDVLDSKDGVSLPPVSNLTSAINGNEITVQWSNPANIPDEISRPYFIYIQVYRENTLEYQIALEDEPATWNYTLPASGYKYRVIVKTMGYLKNPVYGKSDEIYSLGQTTTVN